MAGHCVFVFGGVREVALEMSSQRCRGAATQGDKGTELMCKALRRKELIMEDTTEVEVAGVTSLVIRTRG